MHRTLCAAILVLGVICIGCGRGAGERTSDEAAPAPTVTAEQQPADDSPDLAKEGFDAGEGEELQPNQGAEDQATSEDGS